MNSTSIAAARATTLVEQINESVKLANSSENPSTKVSRLEVARAKLAELEKLAARHPFMSITNLAGIHRTIQALEREFTEAGRNARTPYDQRSYMQQQWRGLDVSEVTDGWEFSAVIQLRTPLRVLLLHGTTTPSGSAQPEALQHEGTWLPKAKTWREMGIGLDEFSPSIASDIGPIPCDGGEYLKFLLKVRRAVEGEGRSEDRLLRLREELSDPSWATYCRRLGGKRAICDKFFPAFIETIPGLQAVTQDALRSARLTTPAKIAKVSDADLKKLKGIGPAKLQAIREACAKAADQDSQLADLVQR